MRAIDWKNLALDDGILSEPVREDNRIVLWLPVDRDRDFQYWERIGTAPRGEIKTEQGICATAATSIRARQRTTGGLLGKLARKLTGGGDESWVLPNGKPAEKCGERRTDLMLIWPEAASVTLDEARVRSRWPAFTRLQRLGDQLFLVADVGGEPTREHAAQAPGGVKGTDELGCPIAQAEQRLEAVRQSGDRLREVAALTDLGIITMNEGDLNQIGR